MKIPGFGKLVFINDDINEPDELVTEQREEVQAKKGTKEILKPVDMKVVDQPKALPVPTGRSSKPTVTAFTINQKLAEIPPDFAIEWLSTMENLAAYNQDFSYALDNIVQLANTPHTIYFADDIDKKLQEEMRKHLNIRQREWYQYAEGDRTLKGDLLTQIVINGALSAEIVPDRGLSGVKQVVRVAPKYIRFVYDAKGDVYKPYQKPNSLYIGPTGPSGLVELNPITYKYIAMRRIHEGPYPTPPFITAVEGLIIQKDMVSNLKEIMRVLGSLGFLKATVAPPDPEDGESETDYWNRCLTYLDNEVYPHLEKNLGKGVIAGFKDSHEFELVGNRMNASGASDLVKIVQLIVFAGLKQDPNMLGRNYSTTETFGKVILAKLLSQVKDYQGVVDRFFSELYYMELLLAGYSPGYVTVESEPAMIGDKKADADTEKIVIENVVRKRNEGFIDQTQAANELDYDEPAEDGPVYQDKMDQNGSGDNGKKGNQDKKDEKEVVENIRVISERLHASVPLYQYHTINCDGMTSEHRSVNYYAKFDDKQLNLFANRYFNESFKKYRSAMREVTSSVLEALRNLPENASLSRVQSEVYLETLKAWESEYMPSQEAVSKDQVNDIYDHYRKDKTIFGEQNSKGFARTMTGFDFDIPEAVFDLEDFRAIDFAWQSDGMYLGKFITDPDTKKAVYDYIRREYLDKGLPIGKNPDLIEKFQREFYEMLELEGWKIRRVIDTTVNIIRNDANVKYMNQAKVENYEVIEIIDDLTCPYCQHMDGKTFSVTKAVTKIRQKVNAGPAKLNKFAPFATTIPLNEFVKMDELKLSANKIGTPTYHPLCRGRIVAML